MKTKIVSLFGVTDFLAAVIFVVITVLHNIGGPPRNRTCSNGRRPPLLENGRFPARRHWPNDFPFRSPHALCPSVNRGGSFARSVFTFGEFRFVFFFVQLSVLYRFYDHARKRPIKYDIIFCLSKPTCCSPIPTLQPIYIGRQRIPRHDDDAPPRV